MDDRERIDEWADALLDQHRTAPRGHREELSPEAAAMADAPMVRLATKLSGEPPDPLMLERLARTQRSHDRWAALEAGAALLLIVFIGLVVLAVAGG